jgi:hypothetical protein
MARRWFAGLVAVIGVGCGAPAGTNGPPPSAAIAPEDHDGGIASPTPRADETADAGDSAPASDGGAAAADVGAPEARDCFPACIAMLRRSCERPAVGAGSCTSTGTIMESLYCYSNGVREILSRVKGGARQTFKQPDGKTPCYQVMLSNADAAQSYQTPDGSEVARVVPLGNDQYDVTCDGMTVTVDASDPTCRTLERFDCTPAGYCPDPP